MTTNNGYIYIRRHKYFDIDNTCKLGKTKNIPDRDSVYKTNELKKGYFEYIIEISSGQLFDDTFVEKQIH